MYVNGVRIYSKEIGAFQKLYRGVYKCDPHAHPHLHMENFAANIRKYIDRFDNQPSVEIRQVFLIRSLAEANTKIHEGIVNAQKLQIR